MKKSLLILGVLAVALSAAVVATAAVSFTDPAGDSGTAPDILGVTAANDAAGNLTFTVRTNQPTLAADAFLDIAFDMDSNANTGSGGLEYLFVITANGWAFLRWDGANWVPANAASASANYVNGVATFRVNVAQVGNVKSFVFYADSTQYDADLNVVGEDTAPDGTGVYQYKLTAPLALAATAPVAVPKKPVAGKAFAVGVGVVRKDTGARLASGKVTCAVTLAGKPLRAAGKLAKGVATCGMAVPANAKGKLLKGTIKVTFQGVSTSKTFSYRVG